MWDDVCGMWVDFFDTTLGHAGADRYAWHACADRHSHLKKKFDPPHHKGGLGDYLLLKIFHDGPHPNLARMCR